MGSFWPHKSVGMFEIRDGGGKMRRRKKKALERDGDIHIRVLYDLWWIRFGKCCIFWIYLGSYFLWFSTSLSLISEIIACLFCFGANFFLALEISLPYEEVRLLSLIPTFMRRNCKIIQLRSSVFHAAHKMSLPAPSSEVPHHIQNVISYSYPKLNPRTNMKKMSEIISPSPGYPIVII